MPYRSMRMQQLITWLVAPMALLVGASVIGVPGVSAAGADVYGVGGGSINFPGGEKAIKFAFSGHTGPNGDFGRARITLENAPEPLDMHADVDCVNVFPLPPGAGGYISGVITKVTPQPNSFEIREGQGLMLGFNDFGEPSDPIPDELVGVISGQMPPQFCKVMHFLSFIPIDQGNIVVKIE